MGRLVAFPARGEVLADIRGEGRVGHVSWHHADGVVVISLWRGATCTGTLRMTPAEAARLVSALSAGLAQGYRGPAAEGAAAG